MTSPWVLLSDRPALPAAPPPPAALALVLECALPLRDPAVLIDWQGANATALSVYLDPAQGMTVLLRHRGRPVHHRMTGAIPLPASGIVRVSLGSDPAAGRWTLRVEAPDTDQVRTTRGRDPMPLDLLADMVPAAATRHPALLWFGLAHGDRMPAQPRWIGPATPVDTPQGPRAAAVLRTGDIVTTLAGPRPLIAIRSCETPVSGSLAPVRLRAPWFAARTDLIVSADQPVMLSGVAVEYMFGEDTVLAEAGMLAGGMAAIRDARPGVVTGLTLTLPPDPDPAAGVILADGCALAVSDCPGLRRLAPFEAVPLASRLGPGLRGRAA